jgi:hypothetical protein
MYNKVPSCPLRAEIAKVERRRGCQLERTDVVAARSTLPNHLRGHYWLIEVDRVLSLNHLVPLLIYLNQPHKTHPRFS